MSAAKAAAAHIDWTKLTTSLGLKTETVAALGAFRKRNEEARRILSDLKEQKTAVDFAHYRKVLKNQAVVDELEKTFKAFKPTAYDVQAQVKSIDAVEAKAVDDVLKSRPEIAEKVDALLAKSKWDTKGYNEKFGYINLF
ncbi:ATP synthase d subunit [Mortierella sp. GBA43]|nr:ATP synthase d subunit [Mortierella sp. GBA43]